MSWTGVPVLPFFYSFLACDSLSEMCHLTCNSNKYSLVKYIKWFVQMIIFTFLACFSLRTFVFLLFCWWIFLRPIHIHFTHTLWLLFSYVCTLLKVKSDFICIEPIHHSYLMTCSKLAFYRLGNLGQMQEMVKEVVMNRRAVESLQSVEASFRCQPLTMFLNSSNSATQQSKDRNFTKLSPSVFFLRAITDLKGVITYSSERTRCADISDTAMTQNLQAKIKTECDATDTSPGRSKTPTHRREPSLLCPTLHKQKVHPPLEWHAVTVFWHHRPDYRQRRMKATPLETSSLCRYERMDKRKLRGLFRRSHLYPSVHLVVQNQVWEERWVLV